MGWYVTKKMLCLKFFHHHLIYFFSFWFLYNVLQYTVKSEEKRNIQGNMLVLVQVEMSRRAPLQQLFKSCNLNTQENMLGKTNFCVFFWRGSCLSSSW